ncbi:flavin reductase family protein [Orrella marina]|uniref:Flavin reductase like domain-containing protein n=1 Tax=Orrella marina TaxID=2163011 RepID=A0A2R4XG49_9BURK|nr:flavin reductase family protein [Orrella marina]AWB32788.1 hypothetical protein DBV39_02605 [Orrella marina]
MYYESGHGHGLPHNPFKAIIAPRPIGWISTVDSSGRANLAPYSFFNAVSSSPDMIAFTSEGLKDSARHARDSGEFVFNLVTMPLLDKMNLSSASVASDISEFDFADIEMAESRIVKAPRVAQSPAAIECKVVMFSEFTQLSGQPTDRYLIVGQVVGVHIQDEYIVDGQFDMVKAQTVARCGYRDYCRVGDVFEVMRPDDLAQ